MAQAQHLQACLLFDTAGAQTNGSWRVVGSAGAVPIHALPFTDETVLFWERNSNSNGSSNSVYYLRVSLSCKLFVTQRTSTHQPLYCQLQQAMLTL